MAEGRPLKVIVGLDLASAAAGVVEAAALLAAALKSELSGVFVEEEALAHAVALPFTALVRKSGALSPIDPVRLQRTLGLAASEAEKALVLAAEQAKLRATFRTVRGRLLAQLLAQAAEHDLIVLGSMVSPRAGTRLSGSVVAVFDRAAIGTPLLEVALAIAGARRQRLVIVVQKDDDPEPLRVVLDWAERGRARVRPVEVLEVQGIAKALKRENASLLLCSAASDWLREASLQELRAEADCPLVLVR